MNQAQLLDFAIANGIINLDTIQAEVDMKQRQVYLDMHQGKIWQGTGDYWYTVLPETKQSKRRLVKKKNYKDLENAIITFYETIGGAPTVKQCFDEWIAIKKRRKEICQGTIDRYENDYKRFFSDSYINNRKVDDITEEELEDFIKDSISEFGLTTKAYGNLRTLIRGIFKHAKHEGYTQISVSEFFGDLELSRTLFTRPKKKIQAFKTKEHQILIKWLEDNPTVPHYGLILTFLTGIRCGELVALRFTDFEGNMVHVHSQEISYKDPDTKKRVHEVVDYTKTEAGDRWIAIPDSALKVVEHIKELNPKGEFLMTVDGRRMHTNSFNGQLARACTACGLEERSMHKIRKTYATKLLDSGVPGKMVTNQMGHENISTTYKCYWKDAKDDLECIKIISEVVDF